MTLSALIIRGSKVQVLLDSKTIYLTLLGNHTAHRKPFYLSHHGDIWYARIVDQKTGEQLSAISTGHSDRDLAVMTVSRWFVEGLPKIKTKTPRPVSEAITVNRLFNIL